MAHPGLTGVLLVGGASERFGSPKALAFLRGETLAERGRRLLREACDEVISVGKTVDASLLPGEIVDDGVESRAPVHGVIAALRAARHETCVVLPVDCPLVTAGVLRSLGESVAVAPEGPLPGAYTREMLPVLEQRVARGELSLKGVNPTRSQLPEELFIDVDTPDDLAALERPRHALVVGGTGMLAGVTTALAERGHPVTVIARRPVALGVSQLMLDYRETAALERGLETVVAERGPIELSVLWVHTDGPAVPAAVAEATAPGGRVVQVFGTRVWPLDPVPVHVAYRHVLLGSIGGRWLTNTEISDGVLTAIDTDEPVRVVGDLG